MNNRNCNSNVDCLFLSIAASIILGVAAAILQYTAIISVGTVFPWVALGVAVVDLLALAASATNYRSGEANCCICRSISVFIAAVLGVVLTALILLAISFAATSVLGAIFAGLLVGFFALLITSAACLLKCTVNCSNEE